MQKSYQENACVNGNPHSYGKQDCREKRSPSNNDKSPYHIYGVHKSEKNVQGQNKFKSSSGFIGINNLTSPTHSVFQRKIRQAIEMRYTRSKINAYRYMEIQDPKSQVETVSVQQNSPQHSSKSSQLSEQMQAMKHFAFLKNISFINIYQFHSQKSTIIKKEESKENDKYKKRRFKLPSSYGIVITEQKQSLSSRQVGKIKIPQEVLEKKDAINKMDESSHNFYCSNDMQQIHEQKQKRFLTSRLPYKKDPTIVQSQKQKKSISSLSRQLAAQNQNQAKDTFKLKYSNKILNKNQHDSQNFTKIEEKTERSSKNAKTKARRFLKNIKTEPNQQSQLNYQIKNSNLDSSYKKLVSLRKIQTQFIEPALNQQQIYNKTTKNKARMIKNYRNNNFLINKTNQNSQRSFHISSEQKWKLEEISFKFKPINQIQMDQTSLEMEKLAQNKNQALKLGLSLQKAYQKLMQNKKKMQKKGQSSARIDHVSQETNKRRLLRVSPKNENPLRKSVQKESKFTKKDQALNFCSPLLENRSQMSLGRESTKYKFLKHNKGQRISTIE